MRYFWLSNFIFIKQQNVLTNKFVVQCIKSGFWVFSITSRKRCTNSATLAFVSVSTFSFISRKRCTKQKNCIESNLLSGKFAIEKFICTFAIYGRTMELRAFKCMCWTSDASVRVHPYIFGYNSKILRRTTKQYMNKIVGQKICNLKVHIHFCDLQLNYGATSIQM